MKRKNNFGTPAPKSSKMDLASSPSEQKAFRTSEDIVCVYIQKRKEQAC